MARSQGARNYATKVLQSIYDTQISNDAIESEITITNVFARTFACKKRIILNRGGAGSSKSKSMSQLITYKMLYERNKAILILRKSLPSFKISTMPMIYKTWEEFGVRDRFREEKNMLNYYYESNWCHFGSIDDVEKVRSSEWNYIWIEEATELKLNDFKVIRTRLRAPTKDGNPNQLFLSFNPIDERNWIKKDVLDKLDPSIIEEIHSTYRDNPFLPQEAIDDLEDTRNQDRNFWRYMALGEWGRLENLVYSNWDTCSSIPSDAKIIYGVDFGFNAPSVLLKVGYIDNDVWEEELIYESGLTNPEFIAKCKKEIPPSLRNSPIYCDTAEPDRIKEMTQSGLNAKYADKKINEGIDFVKRLKVHIVDSSTNTIKEKSAYVYQTDKEGHPVDKPVEYGDHAMSAERYALYTHLKRGSQYKIRWLS